MTKIQRIPERTDVNAADTWDLSSLYPADEAWEKAFRRYERRIAGFDRFRGGWARVAPRWPNA